MNDLQILWRDCLNRLRANLPPMQFQTWLQPLSCQHGQAPSLLHDEAIDLEAPAETLADNTTIIISAPARRVVQYVEEHFLEDIRAFFTQQGYSSVLLQQKSAAKAEAMGYPGAMPRPLAVSARSAQSPIPANASDAAQALPQMLSLPAQNLMPRNQNGLQTHYTFDKFVIGKSNQLAHAAALQVAEHPGLAYNPFYLYGGVGLGKTHLVHAIGNTLAGHHGLKVRYIHADDYFNEIAKAMRYKSYESFKNEFRSLDAIIVDDVQFVQGRERTQEELFYLFNALMETGRQVIVTSDRYPRDIEGLQDRLRSRFQWGLTVAIEPPEIELRVAILQRKAELERIELDTPSAYYIARHLKANVRELEGALTKVVQYTRFHHMPINADTVRLALKDVIGQVMGPLSIEAIQKVVCDFCRVRPSDMHAKSRTRVVVRARQMAMWLTRDLTTLSLPTIGESFGGRDHTTVLHACKTIEALRQKDQKFNQELRVLQQMLRGD